MVSKIEVEESGKPLPTTTEIHGNPFLATFRPYIPASVTNVAELTVLPLIVGTLLGIIFGASSLYLVLKTGLTVSASIPVAVISITLFRILSKARVTRDATILENNVVQTAGSAGESIAFGVGVTMPAILILGFDLDFWRVMLVAVLGGLLGILMMIPLRRALIRDQHGILKYPEGTACAEVLKAGASAESRAIAREHSVDTATTTEDDSAALQGGKIISIGFALGFVYKALGDVFSFWKAEPEVEMGETLPGGSLALENNPALLGVGYIIGPYIAGIMFAGGVLSYMVLIPMIKFFGGGLTTPLAPGNPSDPTQLISAMSTGGIRNAYILYIGAGAVVAGGLISLARSIPTIWHGIQSGLADIRGRNTTDENGSALPRTDRDLSINYVIIGILALIAIISFTPVLKVGFFGALLIVIFGFLFVTVSSRLTGEVGSSSNPISGMTVATLLFTCLIFLALGWTAPDPYFVTALSVGGIVCIAASNGGTTSQDLKTGFLVGATPGKQQIAILVGALASALILGPMLLFLNDSGTYYQRVKPETFANVTVTPDQLSKDGADFRGERAGGKFKDDPQTYRVWHNTDAATGIKGKYLVDTSGKPVYFVDPKINGVLEADDEGNALERYDAPKATLMSYIIKGILNQELPWGLVLLGAMIAIVLELARVPSLAFAVGLYLPISTSAPIFVGGIARWGVDKYLARKLAHRNLTEAELVAETDKSNGVLLASGYIAGAAITGVLVAFFATIPTLETIQRGFADWAKTGNPVFAGANADWLAMIPFILLALFLYFVGRERFLSGRRS